MALAHCVICSDAFDGVERIMATPCGHVYHSKCLLKWIDVKESCPECRKAVVKKDVTELYFSASSTQLENTDSLRNEIHTLKTLLEESNDKASELLGKNEKFTDLILKNVSTINSLHHSNLDMNQKLQNCMGKIPLLKQRLTSVRAEAITLKRKLLYYDDVKTLLSGVRGESENLLNEVANSAGNESDLVVSRRLAHRCCVVEKELKASNNEIVELNQHLRIAKIQSQLANDARKVLQKDIKALKKKYAKHHPSTSSDTPCAKRRKHTPAEDNSSI